jgi:hypothetical protein
MLTKQEQRSWVKTEVARGRSAQNCYQGLREACGHHQHRSAVVVVVVVVVASRASDALAPTARAAPYICLPGLPSLHQGPPCRGWRVL